jgi:ABC-type glycerol-3-phosphate transport system substrate-binding protein
MVLTMKKILLVTLCLGVLGACSSAVVTPEGAEANYSWVEGALESALAGAMPEVVEATKATLTDLELVGIDSAVDGLKGKITARMAVGTKVQIGLEAIDFESTSIRIKVGTFGDRSVALQILRNVEKRLGK